MTKAAGAPAGKVFHLLPAVRVLAVAALLAFVVTSAFTGYQLVTDTGNDRVTNQQSDASEESTGDVSAGDGPVTGVGESAASGAVPPEQPGEAAPSRSQDDQSSTAGDDDLTIWLASSAGLGVLALALGGYWVYLVRTGSPQAHPA